MDYFSKKKLMMRKLKEAISKNAVDVEILPFLEIINKQQEFFTTSSCAGRIVILEVDKIGKKEGSKFIYKKHESPDFNELKKLLISHKFSNEAWLLVEPPIFHLGANNLENAKKILNLGLSAGLRRSGIRSISDNWIIVQLWGTGHMDIPLGNKKNNYFYNNHEYTDFVLDIAKNALHHGKNQLKRFFVNLKEDFIQDLEI
jgi:tRNA wybutosine-synthesizing protein 3